MTFFGILVSLLSHYNSKVLIPYSRKLLQESLFAAVIALINNYILYLPGDSGTNEWTHFWSSTPVKRGHKSLILHVVL